MDWSLDDITHYLQYIIGSLHSPDVFVAVAYNFPFNFTENLHIAILRKKIAEKMHVSCTIPRKKIILDPW